MEYIEQTKRTLKTTVKEIYLRVLFLEMIQKTQFLITPH